MPALTPFLNDLFRDLFSAGKGGIGQARRGPHKRLCTNHRNLV
jgi:hypothetical protein